MTGNARSGGAAVASWLTVVLCIVAVVAFVEVPGALRPWDAQPAAASTPCGSSGPGPGSYANPVLACDLPDPDVVRVGGGAYAFGTGGGDGMIQEAYSPDLSSWQEHAGGALANDASWATPGFEWAPDVIEVGASWLMFYATRSAHLGVQCVTVAVSSVVGGPYANTTSGPLVCQSGTDPRSGEPYGGSLDPSVFEESDGSLVLLWKSNDGSSPAPAYLWAQPLDPAGTALAPGSAPVVLLNQDQGWESTIESPEMVFVDGAYYLFYSGGLWTNASYGVGYALCLGPLGPCAKPADHAVLASDGEVVGPGGESLFQDGQGRWWMAYHGWSAGAVGYGNGGARSLRMDPVCFVDGVPVVLGPSVGPQSLDPSCPSTADDGYRLVGSDGGVFAFGAPYLGAMAGTGLSAAVVGAARDEATGGYWLVASDGGVFAFDAPFFGSMAGTGLSSPIVGMAPTPDGHGYWLVASDGGVFAFGDAAFAGSMGGTALSAPIVAMAVDAWTGGYWLVGADGGVFAFGAPYLGSMGGAALGGRITGAAVYEGGVGYWLVGADGGVFAFGAPYLGSMGGAALARPVVAIASDGFAPGYWLVGSDGGVFSFGAPYLGSTGGIPLAAPVVAAETS